MRKFKLLSYGEHFIIVKQGELVETKVILNLPLEAQEDVLYYFNYIKLGSVNISLLASNCLLRGTGLGNTFEGYSNLDRLLVDKFLNKTFTKKQFVDFVSNTKIIPLNNI